MATMNVVTSIPVAKGNWQIFLQGLLSAVCTRVKIPAVTYGEVTAHPGGAPSRVSGPSGTIEYDDLTMTCVLGEGLPDTLWLWWQSIVNPLTGFGVPAIAAYRPISISHLTNSFIPQKNWEATIWPHKREWDELEGGSNDPSQVVMTFKVGQLYEVGL
jgi:hypothetical protein